MSEPACDCGWEQDPRRATKLHQPTCATRVAYEYAERFLAAYIECALWSTNDESTPAGGVPLDRNYDRDKLADATLAKMRADCEAFVSANRADLDAYRGALPGFTDGPSSAAQAGHDFWLTRNGHGTGFWDRDAGDVGERLAAAAQKVGEVDLYVGDDGKLYT